ncbi:MAG: cupin domain-containing protein [Eubacteriales bacterium]|nr:cupin domain-containing protein [Eubacteriales bacterium]
MRDLPRIWSLGELSEECEIASGQVIRQLSQAAGCRKLDVKVITLPPKTCGERYHSHSEREEFFLILSGAGILRLGGERLPVSSGDFFSKPTGTAHSFYNAGVEPLLILEIGTTAPGDVMSCADEGEPFMARATRPM